MRNATQFAENQETGRIEYDNAKEMGHGMGASRRKCGRKLKTGQSERQRSGRAKRINAKHPGKSKQKSTRIGEKTGEEAFRKRR